MENDCSPAILWDLTFLCFSCTLLFCDLFAAMGLRSRAFGGDLKSLGITKIPFFLILCCTEGHKMASHSFTLALRLISFR